MHITCMYINHAILLLIQGCNSDSEISEDDRESLAAGAADETPQVSVHTVSQQHPFGSSGHQKHPKRLKPTKSSATSGNSNAIDLIAQMYKDSKKVEQDINQKVFTQIMSFSYQFCRYLNFLN